MGETNFSLINLKALSEPVIKLIDTVSKAVGGFYEPIGIRRRAKAEAEAAVILAESQSAVRSIESRTESRLKFLEQRRQHNIEAIAAKSLTFLPGSISQEPVDEDWVVQFFEHCKDMGNEQMQSVWAKILAGEVTNPGTFSLRTLGLVKMLHQDDAMLFTEFRTYMWSKEDLLYPIIVGTTNNFTTDCDNLVHLESLGLIHFEGLSYITINVTTELELKYYRSSYRLRMPDDKNELIIGNSMLTDIGQELAPIAGGTTDVAYRDRVIDFWRENGIEVTQVGEDS